MMTCNDIRTLLEGSADDVAREPAIAAHIQNCPDCAAYASLLPSENEDFEALIGNAVDEESWQRVCSRVAARLPRESIRKDSHKRLSRRKIPPAPNTPWNRTPWLVGAAALVGVALLGGMAYQNSLKGPVTPTVVNTTPKSTPTPSAAELADAARQPKNTPAPKVAENQPRKPQPLPRAVLNTKLTQFQSKMRAQNILDDVEQLSIALAESKELEAKSTTDDAELHFERLLMLENVDSDAADVELRGSKDEAQELRDIQDALNADAPAEFKTALARAIATFDEAANLGAMLPDEAPAHASAAATDKASLLIANAENHLRDAQYADAMKSYRAFLDTFPKDRRVAQARYTVAFILEKKLGDADGARAVYQTIADTNGQSQLASHALYHMGETYERTGDTTKALATFEKLKTQDAHAAASITDKVAFLDKKIKGVQAPRPGWGAQVQSSALMKPVKKTTRSIMH